MAGDGPILARQSHRGGRRIEVGGSRIANRGWSSGGDALALASRRVLSPAASKRHFNTNPKRKRGNALTPRSRFASGAAAGRNGSRETCVGNSHEFRYSQPVTVQKSENFGVLSKNVGKMVSSQIDPARPMAGTKEIEQE